MERTKNRNISMEYLRIFSMFLIILLHSIDHSGLFESLIPGSFLYYTEIFFYSAVQICVNCFVMLSGYFLINSKFKPTKLIQLWIEVFFYSIAIKIILMAIGNIPFSITSLIGCFIPIISGRYWFITIYFGLYLLTPFLNIAIKQLTKKQHTNLCLILFVLMSALISIYPSFAGMNSGGGWGLAWFIVLYIFGSYFRLHDVSFKFNRNLLLIFYLLISILMSAAKYVGDIYNISFIKKFADNLFRYDSVPVFISTLLVFAYFNSKQIKKSKAEKLTVTVSATTFGVYLIHAHANICIPAFWQKLGILTLVDNWWYPLYQIGITIAIFILCSALDYIRLQLFKLIKIDRIIELFYSSVKNITTRFTKKTQ